MQIEFWAPGFGVGHNPGHGRYLESKSVEDLFIYVFLPVPLCLLSKMKKKLSLTFFVLNKLTVLLINIWPQTSYL